MKVLYCALGLLIAAPLLLTQQVPMTFSDCVKKYLEMSRILERTATSQTLTNASAEIIDRQQQLAAAIAKERRDARQGDLFTPETTEQVRKIIQEAFKEPGGIAVRRTLLEEQSPAKGITLKVNGVYPDNQPYTTMPPTLLGRLPALPKELAYRVIEHALVLQDTRTNQIVDFIPNVIP